MDNRPSVSQSVRPSVPRLIERKRDGHPLGSGEWRTLIQSYVADEVPDYQMAAMAMAVFFRGLEPDELNELVDAMLLSGERLDLTGFPLPRVDKHSIGGVGDKTSLLLAPMLACCGVGVPMISGRGLGHTGGTLDKLEAIPGFRTGLTLAEAREQLDRIGVVMLGQTPQLVPADRKLYALRDVTGTVESIPLIAASIMSKKLAEDITGLVLDIKTGSGSFLPDPEQSRRLAETMIGIGEARGCRTVCLLTAMDRPLGLACGNALEVREAIAGLRGEGPPDLMEVTLALGVEMLRVAQRDAAGARQELEEVVRSGRGLAKLRELIQAQGGDPRVVDDPSLLPEAPVLRELRSPEDGLITQIEPRTLGHGVIWLGGGRSKSDDTVDPAVGFVIPVKPGQRVSKGQLLGTVHARDEAGAALGLQALRKAIRFGERARPLPLIGERIAGRQT
jgi:pyrimidine-nucleoside phosphorylase